MTFSAKHQQGLTFISILFILIFIACMVLLTFKIAPIYMQHSKVVNSLAGLEEMVDVETMSKRELMYNLNKRFGLNYVDHIKKEDVNIVKHGNYVKVEIVYERVEKIVGNLSVLAEFSNSFEIGGE